ncbi:hypothetical protein ACEWY4_010770 [Coilia grayii]|uniref:Ig-like domain-containing protein n=1 Tax=Coilia grayii TaxID=363190 RepID=A0ABD1K2U9_9TELE
MDQLRDLGVLLILLLGSTHCFEDLEPVLKAVGDSMEMGFCFGVDYIVGYRMTDTGRQLVGNSSGESVTKLDERVKVTNHIATLLGLEISNLTSADSGVYLRQCWRDLQLINEQKHYLYVCGEAAAAQDISISSDGGAKFNCETSRTGLPSTSIRWYREVYPKYKTTLFLDTQLSLKPIQPELQDEIQVGAGGSSLHIPASVMKESRNFHCLVLQGEQCLAFQNIELPDSEEPDVKTVFRSIGESVQLPCPTKHPKSKRYWETPFGHLDSDTPSETADQNHLRAQEGGASGGYSLLVSHLTESHTGDYKCFAPLLVADYAVTVCPKHDAVTMKFEEGEKVVLTCMPEEGQFSVQWYREDGPNEEALLADSGDPSILFPKDLEGRALFSEEKFTLTISRLTPADSRKYWCVILEEVEFTDGDYEGGEGGDEDNGEGPEVDIEFEAEGEAGGDAEEDFGGSWDEEDKCLSRRAITLIYKNYKDSRGFEPPEPAEPTEPSDPEPATNPAVFGIAGGVIGLVVLGAVIGAVLKVRAKQKQHQSGKVKYVGSGGEVNGLAPEKNKP